MKHIFLCSLPRSGTALFLDLLQCGPFETQYFTLAEKLYKYSHLISFKSDPLLKLIGSHVHKFLLTEKENDLRINRRFDRKFFSEIIQKHYTDQNRNGYITVKWFPNYFDILISQIGDSDKNLPQKLFEIFGDIAYIRLIRQDVIRQAISFYIALESNQWYSFDNAPIAVPKIRYDFKKIKFHYKQFQADNAHWDLLFERYGIQPTMTIIYEEFIAHHQDILNELAKQLDCPIYIPEHLAETGVQKVSTTLNDQFYERFVSDMNRFSLLDTVLLPIQQIHAVINRKIKK